MAKRVHCDSLTANSSNKKHRLSGFDAKWSKDFPFVVYVADRGMFCSLCQKWAREICNRNGTWITVPCVSLRRDSILDHSRSKAHDQAVKAEQEAVQARLRGGIAQSFETIRTVQRKALIGALKCMYWLAKREIAHTTSFESLIQLGISLGSTYMKELNQGDNAKYTSQESMFEFVKVLSQCIEQATGDEIQRSDYVSLMCDETTDVSITKQLIVYVRYVVDGELKVRYLKIQNLQDGTADTIESTLLSICQTANINLSKVIGFGSDGAAVMVGCRNGVATRLKSHNSVLISVHCIAHRLALAAGQASDAIPYLKKFKNYLSQLFYYYHNSAVRSASLQAVQELLDDPILKMKVAGDTRWLSHDQAVTTIRRILPSLITDLEREAEEKGDAIALGLVHVVRSFYFVASVYLMSDILPHLSRLSLVFQERDVDFSAIQVHVTNTIEVLQALKSNDGVYMRKLDTVLKEDLADFRISVKDSDPEQFRRNVKVAYIDKLVENINNRFPDMTIISAFSLFNPKRIPESSSDNYLSYGEEQLQVLVEHFGNFLKLDASRLQQEWIYLKQLLTCAFKSLCTREVLEMVIKDTSLAMMLPQAKQLATIALTIPVSTAECERGFSAVKRIKTVLRNRLKVQTLDFLMRISVEGPDIDDFDFNNAATQWSLVRNRRLKV